MAFFFSVLFNKGLLLACDVSFGGVKVVYNQKFLPPYCGNRWSRINAGIVKGSALPSVNVPVARCRRGATRGALFVSVVSRWSKQQQMKGKKYPTKPILFLKTENHLKLNFPIFHLIIPIFLGSKKAIFLSRFPENKMTRKLPKKSKLVG